MQGSDRMVDLGVLCGRLLQGSNGPGLLCDEGETVMVADLLQQAGIDGERAEMEFVDGALVIRRQGAFDGIPKDRKELAAMLLACQFLGGRWLTMAERGIVLIGPFDLAKGLVNVDGNAINIFVASDAQGMSGHVPFGEFLELLTASGITPGAKVEIFCLGKLSNGPEGAGVFIRPVHEPQAGES